MHKNLVNPFFVWCSVDHTIPYHTHGHQQETALRNSTERQVVQRLANRGSGKWQGGQANEIVSGDVARDCVQSILGIQAHRAQCGSRNDE